MAGKKKGASPKTIKTTAAQLQDAIRDAAQAVMVGREPLTGPLVVVVYAFMPIPASWPKGRQREARQRLIRPQTKPDWDNIGKVCDALNGIVWGDDACVVDGSVRKFYAEVPELVITVEPWVPSVTDAAALQVAA